MMLEPKPTIMYFVAMSVFAAPFGVSLPGRAVRTGPGEETRGVGAIAGTGMFNIAIIDDSATHPRKPGCPWQPVPNPS